MKIFCLYVYLILKGVFLNIFNIYYAINKYTLSIDKRYEMIALEFKLKFKKVSLKLLVNYINYQIYFYIFYLFIEFCFLLEIR